MNKTGNTAHIRSGAAAIARRAGFAALALALLAPGLAEAQSDPRPTVVANVATDRPTPPAATATPRQPPPESGVAAIQPFARTFAATLSDRTQITLVDLNPNVHSWFLLSRSREGVRPSVAHIENPLGRDQTVALGEDGLSVTRNGERVVCTMRTVDGRDLFAPAGQPLVAFCNGHLLLRSQQSGYRTTEEAAVSLLRSMGGVGESLINLYKNTVGQDANLERAGTENRAATAAESVVRIQPRAAEIAPSAANAAFTQQRLGIALAPGPGGERPALRPGRWVQAALQPGVFVSLIAPNQIDPAILRSYPERVSPLDSVETGALVYMVAFDLSMYTLNYRLGSDHPAVGWSPRPALPRANAAGPDGFNHLRPLARVGMVPPQDRPRLVAVLSGGYKREHGAFRYGPYAQVNQGSHYGFIENGVILSRPQIGLASIIGRIDGSLEVRTWTREDDERLADILFVRQNGVPVVEADESGRPVPGPHVNSWGNGNWSGALVVNSDGGTRAELRSVRASACLQEHNGRRYLIYGYFSAATPSAMARTFQAYGCRYAMLLDMNSPELTYAALVGEDGTRVEHLNTAMTDADPGRARYRFLSANDNRDFFTVLRRPPAAQ